MKTSNKGINLIKEFEGFRQNAYKCSAGVWTIGYGHTEGVHEFWSITKDVAEGLLKQDLVEVEEALNSLNLDFNQNQFDALVSFTFNVGVSAMKKSTLIRLAKADVNDPKIEKQFLRWDKCKGEVLAGLTKRRIAESKLYFTEI